jgi:hypothetical protein
MAAADINSIRPETEQESRLFTGFFFFAHLETATRQNPAAHVKNVTKNQRLCA